MAAATGDFDSATNVYAGYRQQLAQASAKLKAAETWSLFNPQAREAHFAAVNQLAILAKMSERRCGFAVIIGTRGVVCGSVKVAACCAC